MTWDFLKAQGANTRQAGCFPLPACRACRYISAFVGSFLNGEGEGELGIFGFHCHR